MWQKPMFAFEPGITPCDFAVAIDCKDNLLQRCCLLSDVGLEWVDNLDCCVGCGCNRVG